ncbi:Rv3654c family TadE-like protein [Micrococcus endophyticus]|uniref:Rv3654c family TadE-like protein n=1 Tax=Micrococcus endophyticus TaxID=455343 RepID=UPI0010C80F63|nr:hypothetical protein FDF08_05160 [Micrococcus luteus]
MTGRAPGGVPRGAASETGSGTVSVLGTAALGAGLLLAVAALGQASVAGAQAAGAADLAALAASDARRGLSAGEPCLVAGQTAARNRAVVVECEVRENGTVRVSVERGRAPLPPALAAAVAGPPRLQAPQAVPEDPLPDASSPSTPTPSSVPPSVSPDPSATTGTR